MGFSGKTLADLKASLSLWSILVPSLKTTSDQTFNRRKNKRCWKRSPLQNSTTQTSALNFQLFTVCFAHYFSQHLLSNLVLIHHNNFRNHFIACMYKMIALKSNGESQSSNSDQRQLMSGNKIKKKNKNKKTISASTQQFVWLLHRRMWIAVSVVLSL